MMSPWQLDNELAKLVNKVAYNQRPTSTSSLPGQGRDGDPVPQGRRSGPYIEVAAVKVRNAIISRFKIMAKLDFAKKRKPQDGKIKFDLPPVRPLTIELRVATIPGVRGRRGHRHANTRGLEPIPARPDGGFQPRNLPRSSRRIGRSPTGSCSAWGRPAPARPPRCTRASDSSTPST